MAAVVVVLLLVLVSAQVLAGVAAPPEARSSTGRVLGRTGFAFLGGLRTFGAAVLWNRLDHIHDGFYEGKSIRQQMYMIPSMRLVTLLDPQFVHAYYYAAYALASSGDMEGGLKVAREGIANNPVSGLMRANLVQLLMMQDKKKNLPEIVRESRKGLREGTHYDNSDDAFESLVIFRTAFHLAGDKATEMKLQAATEALTKGGAVSSVQP